MNSINILYKKIKTLPTILNFEDEIYFIENLKKINEEEIFQNKEIFIEILEILQISHQDNGIFEVTNKNINIFLDFINWIRMIDNKYYLGVEKYIDGVEIKLHE